MTAGLAFTQHKTTGPDHGIAVQSIPTIGLSAALMIPLIKSLLVNQLPKATLELAFYDKSGKFVHRQRVGISKAAREGWQFLHIEGHAPKDGYMVARIQNLSKASVYFDDIVFQTQSKEEISGATSSSKVLLSNNGFVARRSTNDQNIYRTGPNDDCGGGGYGAIVENYYIVPGIRLEVVNVTAPAPKNYILNDGGIIVGGSGGDNALPGRNMTALFQQKLEEAKAHFCQQAAYLRSVAKNNPSTVGPYGGMDPTGDQTVLGAFAADVAPKAPYDLKEPGHGYSEGELGSTYTNYAGGILRFDDYGNINFGLAAAASGMPLKLALCGAGIVQWIPIVSGPVDFSNLAGGCGDNSRDSAFIIMGYQMFNGCENAVNYGNN